MNRAAVAVNKFTGGLVGNPGTLVDPLGGILFGGLVTRSGSFPKSPLFTVVVVDGHRGVIG